MTEAFHLLIEGVQKTDAYKQSAALREAVAKLEEEFAPHTNACCSMFDNCLDEVDLEARSRSGAIAEAVEAICNRCNITLGEEEEDADEDADDDEMDDSDMAYIAGKIREGYFSGGYSRGEWKLCCELGSDDLAVIAAYVEMGYTSGSGASPSYALKLEG